MGLTYLLSGRLNANVAPIPSSLFWAHILPPWASTMALEINKPKPVPVTDFVANFVNNLGNISGSIPVPVSFILTITWSSLPRPPPYSSSFLCMAIVILPSAVNLIALLRILSKTWDNLNLSASTKISLSFDIKLRFTLFTFFSIWLEYSAIMPRITSFKLILCFLSWSDWLSIFVTSKISSVSLCNLFAFLLIASTNYNDMRQWLVIMI